MRFLFIFLDGVGLGSDDPEINPFARVRLPNLENLLGGQRLLRSTGPFDDERASLRLLDANLGVAGLPQSATGQAVLLTGKNIPEQLGYHYGPKPNPAVAQYLQTGGIFGSLKEAGKVSSLLNAYPEGYFESIRSGRRLYSAIPLAGVKAGLTLKTSIDLQHHQAISADFTGQGWHEHLGLRDAPLISHQQAGERLAMLSSQADFSFFEYWLSDVAGHHQDMVEACALLEAFDRVLGALVEAWDAKQGLILITSDHGNLEDLSTRRHTRNPVPALLIGDLQNRQDFLEELQDLTGVAPAIQRMLIS